MCGERDLDGSFDLGLDLMLRARGRDRRRQPVDRVVTLAWGLAYLAEACARALIAWTLPTGIVLIASTSAPPALESKTRPTGGSEPNAAWPCGTLDGRPSPTPEWRAA